MDTDIKKNIAVGVVGTGGMGTRHAINLHRFIGGANVSGVYDLDQAHAAAAAKKSGAARVFDDPIKLIEDTSVQAVLIASPDSTHVDMVLACLRAGKPVLCEKPLASTVEDAQKVLDAESAANQRMVSIGFMRRFDPQHAAVKATVMSGCLGKPLLWKGVHRNAAAAHGISGATILTNSAGHDFDSVRFLLDEEVCEVSVRGLKSRSNLHPDTRDLLLIDLVMTNNCLGTAEVFVNAGYGYEVSAEVVCQKGTAITQQPDKVKVRADSHRGFYVSSDWLEPFQDAYVAEVVDWIDSLQTGTLFHGATAWDGYVAMVVTAACIQSLESGKPVPVTLMEKPELYQ